MDPSGVEEQNSPSGNVQVVEEKPTLVLEGSNEKDEKPKVFESNGNRVVLLVTAPLGHSFRSIVRVIGREPPSSPPFDWESHDNNTLPDLASRLKFTTHYALCVIDSKIWDDPSLTLLEKFVSAKFWDHPGEATMSAPSRCSTSRSSTRPTDLNAGMPWSEDHLRTIDSGQDIGRTNMSDEEISRVYWDLRHGWMYMPLYWNCHDLAIRLGHLVVSPSVDAARFLRHLIVSLQHTCHMEIILPRHEKLFKVGFAGLGTYVVAGAASAPLLGPIGVGIFLAGWSTTVIARMNDMFKGQRKTKYMLRLEGRFPALRSLHS